MTHLQTVIFLYLYRLTGCVIVSDPICITNVSNHYNSTEGN